MTKALIYYVPSVDLEGRNRPGINVSILRGLGLDKLIRKPRWVSGPGPDKRHGHIVVEDGAPFTGFTEAQEWQEGPDYWVGMNPEERPGPVDLMRELMTGGHAVTMADKNEWQVPCLCVWPGHVMPSARTYRLNANGSVRTELLEEYIDLGKRVEKVWEQYAERVGAITVEDGDELVRFDIDIEDDFPLVSDALAINYHVDRWGISLLGLFSAMTIQRSIQALLDMPGLLDIAKKKRSAASSLIAG